MPTNEVRRYHVIEAIGRGGFGTVYKAELLGAGGFTKTVALKVLHSKMAEEEGIAERLRDEARMLGLLHHRAIVQVDGLLMLNGRWTVVMEFVEGVDLKRLLGAVQIPPGVAMELVQEIASALHVAYDRPAKGGGPLRLMHRDIKPSNIQVTSNGEVKVLDFGVARAEFDSREAETRSLYFGSIGYMAPERMDSIDTHAGDVYAVGVVLWELLTGQAMGKTSSNRDRHAAHIESALHLLWDRVDNEDLYHLVGDCLAYNVEDRPTARELERRLRNIRLQFPEPWLADWAEHAVSALLAQRERLDDDLSGSILIEEAHITGQIPDTGPLDSGSFARSRSGTRATVAATGVALGAGFIAALTVTLLGGGLVVWWWLHARQAPVDVPTAADDPFEVLAPDEVRDDGDEDSALPVQMPPAGENPALATSPPTTRPTSSVKAVEGPDKEAAVLAPGNDAGQGSAEAAEGRVLVVGDADQVWLVGGGVRHLEGLVPAGTYSVEASFEGAPAVVAGSVSVPAGGSVTLTCKSRFKRCVAQ